MNKGFLKILSQVYPNSQAVIEEIVNLMAILSLPKATELYLTDVHGESDTFSHVLKNASGLVRLKIDEIFERKLTQGQRHALATLVYYPEKKLAYTLAQMGHKEKTEYLRHSLFCLIKLARATSAGYTKSKVRKALPKNQAYILEELLFEHDKSKGKKNYFDTIIRTLISLKTAEATITALAHIIQRFCVDHLHVVGDIYDRGPGAHLILDDLMKFHSVDIQWGNHDLIWMAAASGSWSCIANVVRISLRYTNLNTLENAYAISLIPLFQFAENTYQKDPVRTFYPKHSEERKYSNQEEQMVAKMHKALSIIQFKIEGNIIKNNPQFGMESRLLLDKIDYKKGTITIEGKSYELNDTDFPTIDPKNPYELTEQERQVMLKLQDSFLNSEKLQTHIQFLLQKGSLYLVYNHQLLYHACMPLNEDQTFQEVEIMGKRYKGKALFDAFQDIVFKSYYEKDHTLKQQYLEYCWYLWCGPNSPLFGKDQMTTFERYFIEDKATHKENKNPYYQYLENVNMIQSILEEFQCNYTDSHIISGHVPIKVSKGESPIKSEGKLYIIDGGFSKAYHKETGIGGYTLIYGSTGFFLARHQPFYNSTQVIKEDKDLGTSIATIEKRRHIRVKETDIGIKLKYKIKVLRMLCSAYSLGILKENSKN